MTKPLEGWDEEQRAKVQGDVFDTGLSRHLPAVGTVLLAAVVSFDQPPTEADLSTVLRSPTRRAGSWEESAWEEPKPFTAEELAQLRARFGGSDEEPSDPFIVNARELAHFQEHRARVDSYAAHYGRPPVRTCRDVLELMVAAGILHRVAEDGEVRFRPAWPLPLAEDVFPVTPEERAEDDAIRWRHLHEGTAQDIIRLFKPDDEQPRDRLTTSLERLGRTMNLDPDSVREGIVLLLEHGDFSANIDIARAPRHKVFSLAVDWERFAATRIGIRRGDVPESDHSDEDF
jgi:Family of unknown function (DUF6042)